MPSSPENPSEPPIHRAARRGDRAELTRLLDAGADIETRADIAVGYGAYLESLTPLMRAAASTDGANAVTLALLLERGADLHAISAAGVTAAWYVCNNDVRRPVREKYEEHAAVVDRVARLRCLLDAGLDVRKEDEGLRPLLAEAASAGDVDCVRLLLERGASASPKRSLRKMYSFSIPLCCAAQSGSGECVRLILEAGGKPKATDERGKPPLAYARSVDVVQALLEAGADIGWQGGYEGDLIGAIFDEINKADTPFPNGFEVVDALRAAGAPLDRADKKSGWTRLCFAAFREQASIVEYLLREGASRKSDKEGSTPLHAVCWQGSHTDEPETNAANERIIRALVAAGFDVNARNEQQKTPLHKAVRGDWGNARAVRTLLALGAEADPRDYLGRTPLHRAADKGEPECAAALLAGGADPDIADQWGRTPRDLARQAVQRWQKAARDPEHAGETAERILEDARATEQAFEQGRGAIKP